MESRKVKRIVITFDEHGCPECLAVDDRNIRNWNDAEVHLLVNSKHDICELDTGTGECERRPEHYPERRKIVRKIEVEIDEKKRLVSVTIDGNKAYDRSDPAFWGRDVTLWVESRNWGLDQKVQLIHDFV